MIDRISIDTDFFCAYLTSQKLVLATAESCTAGTIMASLSDIEGCGSFVDCGFVTYSRGSKQRLLNVQSSTIDTYTLTSEEVAREMALARCETAPRTSPLRRPVWQVRTPWMVFRLASFALPGPISFRKPKT